MLHFFWLIAYDEWAAFQERTMCIASAATRMMFVLCFLGAGPALGETCVPPEQTLPAEKIEAFRGSPKAILDAGDLTVSVRDLVASDTTLAPLVVALLPGLDPERSTLVGAALGQAALSCISNFPGDAAKAAAAGAIQQAIAATDNVSALLAYNNAAANVQTASVGVGGAGAGSANDAGIPTGGAYRAFDEANQDVATVAPKLLDSGATGLAALPVSSH